MRRAQRYYSAIDMRGAPLRRGGGKERRAVILPLLMPALFLMQCRAARVLMPAYDCCGCRHYAGMSFF